MALLRGRARELAAQLRPNRWFVAIGAGVAAMTLLHFAAIGMTKVAYMLAVKRSSLLASVVVGRVFFGERGLRRRLPGAAIMLWGVALLGIAGFVGGRVRASRMTPATSAGGRRRPR
jgi:drug/metabolite transporter (DMT)-like permease